MPKLNVASMLALGSALLEHVMNGYWESWVYILETDALLLGARIVVVGMAKPVIVVSPLQMCVMAAN